MKGFTSTLLLLVIFYTATAQVKHIDKSVANKQVSFACNFFDNSIQYIPPPADMVKDADAETWMRTMINRIMEVVGLQNRYQLRAMFNYNNCSAVCLNNNIGQDRFIQFDRAFLEAYQKKTNNRWFVIGVLAHEIGHHLNGHSLGGVGSRPDKEIEADEFAGFILQKLGAPLAQAQGIFSFLNATDGPPTHPIRAKRYEAIKRGWDKAAGKISIATLAFNDADIQDFARLNLQKARKEIDARQRLRYLDAAIKEVPGFAEAVSEKGLALMELKQYDSAIFYCNEAAKMEPEIGLMRYNLAKVLYKAGDLENAALYVEDAVFLKPAFSAAYALRALIQVDKKQFAEADKSCDISLGIQPDTNFELAEVLETKGIALSELGKASEAEQYFAAAKKLNPYSLRIGTYQARKKKGL